MVMELNYFFKYFPRVYVEQCVEQLFDMSTNFNANIRMGLDKIYHFQTISFNIINVNIQCPNIFGF